MFRSRKFACVLLMTAFMVIAAVSLGFSAEKLEKYIPDAAAADNGMTLWQSIKAGGEVMVVLAVLSVIAVALIIYYFLGMKPEKLLPKEFLETSVTFIENKRFGDATAACKDSGNLIGNVLLAGLSRRDREDVIIKEAMEDEGRRQIDGLWQKLSYLADIAAIAPMVGLLGTVLGMIQAFNVIAFQTGAVKPILLASGISKAMITTATGLIIAIPAMAFYSYFRGIVQDAGARLENISTEMYHLLTDRKQ
ncbi:MAG: MotA/TolQ/ExbB proton channel family protein [Candidatus Omnitrophota bacterium]